MSLLVRLLSPVVVLLVAMTVDAAAGTEDTLVVDTAMASLPAGTYGAIVIVPGASLAVGPGVYVVGALTNHGELRLAPGAAMKIRGDVVNTGTIADAGALEMTGDGARISGGGPIAHLVLNAGPQAIIHLDDAVTLGALTIAGGTFAIGPHDLRVDGRYASAVPLGPHGIISTTGTIILNGPVHGAAHGAVRLGWVTGGGTRLHPTPPTTHGRLGAEGNTVRFTAARSVSQCAIAGAMIVDSGAVVTAEGVGTKGLTTVLGDVVNDGTISARDGAFVWRVAGDLDNRGTIDRCTVMMIGHAVTLTTDSGTWGRDASLSYRAGSGGSLRIIGSIIVPRLEIATTDLSDSGVTVALGPHELTVRHRFSSDRARGCRLVTDSVVRIRKDADGIIEGEVRFEGFFDAKIAGRFGAIGRRVHLSMPKRFDGPLEIVGTLAQTPNARLTIGSTASIPSGTSLAAELTIDTGGVLSVEGGLTLMRGMRGGGTLEMMGTASLDVGGPIADSVHLKVGRDSIATTLAVARSMTIPRMTIHVSGLLLRPPGVVVDVGGELRYRIAVSPGYGIYAAAVRPVDPRPSVVFPGANTPVYRLSASGGYVVADTIRAGEGYWISFPAAGVIEQRGAIINPAFASAVHDGWNMIGGLSVPVEAAGLVDLETVRQSELFTYGPDGSGNPGYTPVTTMMPGKGYLVEYDGAGIVVRTEGP